MKPYPDYGLIRHDGNRRSVYFDADWPADNLAMTGPTTWPPSMEDPPAQEEPTLADCGFERVGTYSYDDQRRGGKVRATGSLIVRMT